MWTVDLFEIVLILILFVSGEYRGSKWGVVMTILVFTPHIPHTYFKGHLFITPSQKATFQFRGNENSFFFMIQWQRTFCLNTQVSYFTLTKLLAMFIILRKTPHLFQHYSPHTEPTIKWKSTKERFQT